MPSSVQVARLRSRTAALDNEILMGWYAANDGSIWSKGTMYFVLHPHGMNMAGALGRTGGYAGRIMSASLPEFLQAQLTCVE